MKNLNALIIILSIMLSFNIKTKAQEDTVIIENSTEPIKESDFNQKRKYKYLDNNFREEKSLIKLGILPLNFFMQVSDIENFYKHINLTLSLEKKICSSLSIINDYVYSNVPVNYIGERYFTGNLGIRYYYAMNKRIKNSIGANNFHNNYFSIKIDDLIKYGNIYHAGRNLKEWSFEPSLDLSWGLQRRINKFGYVDVGPFMAFHKSFFELGLNLQLGLGLGFKK